MRSGAELTMVVTMDADRVQKLFVQKLQEKFNLNLLGLKKAFSNYDLNKDGLLDVPEIQKCICQFLSGVSEDSIASLVKLYDTNGDGKISYEEFLSVLRNPKLLKEMRENALPEPPNFEADGEINSIASESQALSNKRILFQLLQSWCAPRVVQGLRHNQYLIDNHPYSALTTTP